MMMNLIESRPIKPLPAKVYFSTVILLTIAGFFISAYLSFSHYQNFTDIKYKSFCAISKAINCDTVSQSAYAVFLGVPVAVWGMVGYGFMFIVLCFALDKNRMRIQPTLFLMAFIFSIASFFLGIVSSFYINAYCIMCIASWVINFFLLYMFWLIRRRYEKIGFLSSIKNDVIFWKKNRKVALSLVSLFFVLTAGLLFLYPDYWHYELTVDTHLKTGITKEGHPWIGAENPQLTIIEFSDYRCFQCKKMHFFLRKLVAQYPDKLRIVHRHFPMDHKFNPMVKDTFHSGAGILSLIAISAVEQNRFWETNDYLFNYDMSHNAIYLRIIANDLKMDLKQLQQGVGKRENREKLLRDIRFGINQKFTGTPAYIINDQVFIGQIPPEILKSLDD